MVSRYGDDAYIKGYRVFTTVESERQIAANNALQNGLLSYDRDHGWRKPTKFVDFIYTDDSTTIDWEDRKSTRLNSSHVRISYAVFCLKKKTNNVTSITH